MPTGRNSISPRPKQLLRSGHIENRAGVDLRGYAERDPGRNVRFDDARNDVDGRALRRDNQMDARRASHLGQPADRILHVVGSDHHQVGKLVDDDDDIRQAPQPGLSAIKRVVTFDIPRAGLGEHLVALLHLDDDFLKRKRGAPRIGHDRREQMGNAVVHVELDHLGIDHQQLHFIGLRFVQDARNNAVDADRFTRTRRARDEQMRHFGQVADDRLTGNIPAERDGQLGGRIPERRRLHNLAHRNDATLPYSALRCRWRICPVSALPCGYPWLPALARYRPSNRRFG